jgi:hypothetical protein
VQKRETGVHRTLVIFLLLALVLSACGPSESEQPSTTPEAPLASPTGTHTPPSSATPSEPTLTTTPDVERFPLEAIVWTEDPRVPVLTYHQFAPNYAEVSTAVKTRLEDFEAHLQSLYDHGFSLVPLQAWLEGDLRTPEDRRPLIFTMDDAFFNNQIRLDESGNPTPETGLGILWRFAQEHPDFGFHAALFVNLGDKLYADPDDPGWEMELAQTIVWCIENGAIPYNHFYTHPRLDKTATKWLLWEAEANDQYLRELLQMAGREDLISRLGNILALPFGIWPESSIAKEAMLDYETPEGVPVQAVMEVDYIYRPKFLPPPYTEQFDPLHIPRIVATQEAIDYLAENEDQFPRALRCDLGRYPAEAFESPSNLREAVLQGRSAGECPNGIYALEGILFKVEGSNAEQLMAGP